LKKKDPLFEKLACRGLRLSKAYRELPDKNIATLVSLIQPASCSMLKVARVLLRFTGRKMFQEWMAASHM
jgi:hypothetical protein